MQQDNELMEDLTDAERAELQPAEKPEATAPPAADNSAADEANAKAAETLAEANRVLEQARVLREQAAAAANPPPPARDFAGELAALKDEYENGELDVDEYVAKRDVVRDALRAHEASAAEAAAREASTLQAQQQAWETEYRDFMQQEAHLQLHKPTLKALFDSAAVAGVQSGLGYKEALTAARDQIYADLGITLPNVELAVAQRAPKDRPRPTLGDLPAASSALDQSFVERLSGMDIEDLEERLAGMSQAQRDQFLAAQPGGLRDNPRGRQY